MSSYELTCITRMVSDVAPVFICKIRNARMVVKMKIKKVNYSILWNSICEWGLLHLTFAKCWLCQRWRKEEPCRKI